MATAPLQDGLVPRSVPNTSGIEQAIWTALRYAGSLKITCAMFALGVLILLVGTLAQDEETIVDVKRDYFNSWVAKVDFDVFVPQTIWRHEVKKPGTIFIPGGATIGLIMLINLIAAKMTRFHMTARGTRFAIGFAITLIGFALIAMIVFGAHLGDGLQGEPPFSYDTIWAGCVASLWLSIIGLGAWAIKSPPRHSILRIALWVVFSLFLSAGIILALAGDSLRIPDPGLRIVWQLAKSLIVSVVLLVGLTILFGARGGNVLIHLGIGLLMIGQFAFGDRQREERISLYEGQRTRAAVQTDIVELAVIDKTQPDKDTVVAFDDPLISKAAADKTLLTDKSLPFEIRVEKWMPNSDLKSRRSNPDLEKEADGVVGLPPELALVEVLKSGGAKSEMNIASAYLSIREKKTSKELGRFAVSQLLNDTTFRPKNFLTSIESDGRQFDLALRFRRNLKPFSFELKDVELKQYTGTAIPKDYSSYVRIVDDSGSTLQEGRIWMNSPMRFRGETYYQSSYSPAAQSPLGVEQTVLQVVTNAGWLIPYVSCVLVGLGMLAHFSITLTRFASRYDRKAIALTDRSPWYYSAALLPVLLLGSWLYVRAKTPTVKDEKIDWYAIGTLPVQHEGRIKPLSGVGAQVLKALSDKPFALSNEGHSYEGAQETGKQISAAEWLMGVMVHEEWVRKAPLVRIDSIALLDELGLERHKSHRYSIEQIDAKLNSEESDTLQRKFQELARAEESTWSVDDRNFMRLQTRMGIFYSIWNAYEPVDDLLKRIANDPERLSQVIEGLGPVMESIKAKGPPAIIPPTNVPEKLDPTLPPPQWNAYAPAFYEVIKNFDAKNLDNPTSQFRTLAQVLRGGSGNSKQINAEVSKYSKMLEEKYPELSRTKKARFEAWYGYFNPISISYVLYIVAGLTAFLGLICSVFSSNPKGALAKEWIRQVAFWICVITLAIHTVAIISRIYISERPPVVSLYSASVFIGWAIVLAAVVAEMLFPISISLLVAATAGYLSLLLADGLDIGDSMPVLQAVLDTQFWLSTHVISVSLGYSATFLAGFLGIGIVVVGVLGLICPVWFKEESRKKLIDTLYRVCYGVVCFGIFFSFVGTVLGGLWGDDSWGRFWGWDPKENGALMIVLWNALLLHAKWDKLVGPLGFAMLAIGGNIITAWSMFGTNILGIGLHAYGGETGESLKNMGYFFASQLLFILVGGFVYYVSKLQNLNKAV
jgi:ABC-type transport system involved in cytochrome c biogenesis permease subunit